MKERQEICDLLCQAIQKTMTGHDITTIRYVSETNTVHIDCPQGKSKQVIQLYGHSLWDMIVTIITCIEAKE